MMRHVIVRQVRSEGREMKRTVRYSLLATGAAQILLAMAFFLQLPAAVGLWPFPGTTPLTYIFVASIFAAAGASTLWVAISRSYGALAGIAVDYLALLAPLSIVSLRLGATGGNPQATIFGVMCVLGAAFGLGLLMWSIRIPIDRTVPMPGVVRWSFIVFIVALLIVGTRLLLKVPNAIPWTITPDLSVVIGLMFLGATTYFAYAISRPSWLNVAGQLAGFLAYDVVLIVPFLTRLPSVEPEHQVGLIVYTAVVIYSGLLATYCLFISKSTRIWAGGQSTPASDR
jgi:hypothetical protein